MTSRVEELQRMCDNINENGGLDSEEWHTALLVQIAQNLAVIADVMMADYKTVSQKKDVEWVYNKRERLWYPYSNGELFFKDKPQTDDLQDWKDRMWAEAVIEPQICSFGLHTDCSLCLKESHCKAIKEAERKEREGE